MWTSPSVCQKKSFFDRLPEVNNAAKTSNSHSSAYVDTVEGELRSKSKHLAKQAFLGQRIATPACALVRNDAVVLTLFTRFIYLCFDDWRLF